jgi:opacity protein-like surface antigen
MNLMALFLPSGSLPQFRFRSRVQLALAAALLLSWAQLPLSAQTQQAPPRARPNLERFAVGIRAGIGIANSMRVGSGSQVFTTRDPFTGDVIAATAISTSAEAPPRRFAWGPSVQVNLNRRFGISVDLLTKVVEFDTLVVVDIENRNTNGPQFERSEAAFTEGRYYDLPVMLRYYYFSPTKGKPRAYFAGGVTFRQVKDLNGRLTTTNSELEMDTTTATPTPANESTTGAVVGVGIQLVDDVNVKLELEGRFTRWQDRIFASGPANSNLNQAEVMIGLTF